MNNPSQFGPYTIIRELGRGGMATVFLAHDPRFDREVAIKVLPRQFLHDPNFRARFEREAKTIAALEHPAIVPVYDFGEEGEQPYLVMRYMPGGSLADRIQQGPLSLSETSHIMSRLASALEEAHEKGIIHRDLKPANILFDHRGNPYLGDFGIVKLLTDSAALTGTALIGTPAYMSPEQAQGKKKLDPRSDVYALGTILFEALTGRQPYKADTPMGLALAQINEPVPQIREVNDSVSPGVQEVLSQAMAKDREERFRTATDFADQLQAVSDKPDDVVKIPARRLRTPTPAPRPTSSPVTGPTRLMDQPQDSSGRFGGRRWVPWAIGLAGAALLILGPALYFNLTGDPELETGMGEATPITEENRTPEPDLPAAATSTPAAQTTTTAVAIAPADTPFPTDTPLPTRTPEPEVAGGMGGDEILVAARAGEYAGSTVTIWGSYLNDDAARFEASLASFESDTGIDIKYEGLRDFQSLLTITLAGGDPPDIAAHTQPVVVAEHANSGHLVDLAPILGIEFLERQYGPGWIDDSIYNGQIAGVWTNVTIKSLVWYAPQIFEEIGFQATPTTWENMMEVSVELAAEGFTPWCIGIESGIATGWVATDWLEDVMLRTQPPEVYDAWTAGDLPFDSPEVQQALEFMGAIWQNPDLVAGGADGIISTPFDQSAQGLFGSSPSCIMHRQASFLINFFPAEIVFGEDVDFFVLPKIDPTLGEPLLVSGEIATMYNDRPEVRAVMAYLATGESMRGWIETGGIVSPHRDVDMAWYPDDFSRRLGETVLNAPMTRFDASDQMPSAVGTGAFWSEMTAWAGGEPADEILPAIDAAWPR